METYILILCTSGLVIIFAFLTKEIELEEEAYYISVEHDPLPPSLLLYRYILSFRCDSLSDFHFSLIPVILKQ